MQEGIILTGEKLKDFCREINIDSNVSKILIKIKNNSAQYYNVEENSSYELDIEIAKKYI